MEVLAVANLVKTFKRHAAVKGISFSVDEGICFGLLGPNGAGKTTTIEMMEGISKPTSGEIRYFGKPATVSDYQNVGIQFQNTALPDYLSVKETLMLFGSFYKETKPLPELMTLCSLDDFADQDARKLSGGQRQRLLLALALVNNPKILFLDEPTTGLDPQARRNFWTLIDLIKKQGTTIILTTHYMDEAQTLCDDIVVMDAGEIIAQGSPQGLLDAHFDGVKVVLPESAVPADFSFEYAITRANGYAEILTNQVNQTVNALIARNIDLDGLQVKSPNLEDLFITLTGHALRS
jgi:ABC-2 type transport system ATP-binding protein